MGNKDFSIPQTTLAYVVAPKHPAAERLVLRLPGTNTFRIPLFITKPNSLLASTSLIAYSFGILIVLGAVLLMLPVSSTSGQFTSPIDALFTAASTVSLTGLAVLDTGTYFSTFGQVVLLILIQLGGFGFVAATIVLLTAVGSKLGIKDKVLINEPHGIGYRSSIIRLLVGIAACVLILETIGALIFYLQWKSTGIPGTSLWTAIFHAVSSLNNSGMDIFGNYGSLSYFRADVITLLTTAVLVILGSIGFLVMIDIIRNRRFYMYSLDTKIVLITSLGLLASGTLVYFVAEYSNPATLGPLSVTQKCVAAIFQSVTPRTAGFSTFDIGSVGQSTLFFTMFLMFIGGGSGSTAGGLKTNTLGILAVTVLNVIKGNENVSAFGKQIARQIVYRAAVLLFLYLFVASLIILALSITDDFPMNKILFESFSALGTVGLTTGITPDLSIAGRLIVIAAMLIGRMAPLLFMAFLARKYQPESLEYPRENVRLG